MMKQRIIEKAYSNLLALVLLIIIFSINGCSKEDDLVPNTSYPIDGPYVFSHADGYNLITVNSERYVKHNLITGYVR